MAVEKVKPRPPRLPAQPAKPPKEPGTATYGLRPPKDQKDEVKDGD